jgi:hypothetical protein
LDFLYLLALYRPLKQYPISTKRVVPAEIEKPDWAIDVSALIWIYFSAAPVLYY